MGVIRRTNPSGKEIWGILWTDERGKHVRRYDKAWTKAQAQAALDEIERNLRMGVATHTDLTVADLFHEWHEHHVNVNCSPAYYEDSSTQFRLRIEPMIGHRLINTVNKRIVRQMVSQMQQVARSRARENGYAGHRTINKTLTVLKGMFSYAVEIDQLRENPVHGVPALPEQPTRHIEAWPLPVISAVATATLSLDDNLDEAHRKPASTLGGPAKLHDHHAGCLHRTSPVRAARIAMG